MQNAGRVDIGKIGFIGHIHSRTTLLMKYIDTGQLTVKGIDSWNKVKRC